MNELLAVLCVLGFVLAIVTVVGHGIWVLLALLFKGVTEGSDSSTGSISQCARCGHPHGVAMGRCRFCGALVETGPQSSLKNDLFATVRQLDRLLQRGAIDSELHAKLSQTLRDEHARLMGVQFTSPATTSPAPASPPSEVQEPVMALEVIDEPAPAVPAPLPTLRASVQVTNPTLAASATVSTAQQIEPLPPARGLADVLKAFMQEKNIRWGELASGILIVGCSVALIVSLRRTLQEMIPYFPGLMFMLVTAAIHGAGNYTLRRWNLASTSRGVLIIGTLLVPLNFLAAIILTGPEEKQIAATDPVFLVVVLVGLVSYGTMTYFASRALAGDGWWRIFPAVMGPSVGQLVINRLAWPNLPTWHVTALMALPLASYLLATLAHLAAAQKSKEVSPRRAEQLFLLLGVAAFSLLAPLALLFTKTHDHGTPWLQSISNTLAQLSPSLSLAAAVVLGAGLFVQNKALRPRLATIRTTGTTLAIFGAALLVILVAIAWPQPEKLIAVGLVNAAVLIVLAILAELPVLHLASAACLALAYLVGFHLWQGSFEGFDDALGPRLVQLLILGKSCLALTLFCGVLGAIGAALSHWGRAAHSRYVLMAGAAGALGCIVATLIVAFLPAANWPDRDPSLATPLLYLYAAALLAAGLASRQAAATWAGSLLLWAALVHTLDGNVWVHDALAYLQLVPDRPVVDATLIHAVLGIALAFGAATRKSSDDKLWQAAVVPLSVLALLSSMAAAPFVFMVKEEAYGASAGHAAVIAAVWLAAAWLHRSSALATAFQAMAAAAVDLALLAAGRANGWWDGTPFDLQFLPAHFVVLALWCAAWSGVRQWLVKGTRLADLFDTPWPAVDQALLAVLVRALVIFTALGCWPGVVAELGMTSSVAAWTGRRSHELAYAGPVWIALGAVYAALLAALWERLSRRALAGLFILSAAIPFLISGRFEEQTAVASAVRWTFAIYGMLAAAAICLRSQLAAAAIRLSLRGAQRFAQDGALPRVRILALALGGLPVLLLTLWTFIRVASGETVGWPDEDSIFGQLGTTASFALPLLLVTGTLLAYALRERSHEYALASSALFQMTITLGYVLRGVLTGVTPDGAYSVELLQWNALGLAGFSLLWLALHRYLTRPTTSLLEITPLNIQLIVMSTALAAISVWATLAVAVWPGEPTALAAQLGSWPGYVAWLGGVLAVIWMFRRELERFGVHMALATSLGVLALVAATVQSFDTAAAWHSLHVLGGGCLGLALVTTISAGFLRSRAWNEPPAARMYFQDGSADLAAWATVLGVLAVVLATRGLWGDPLLWWSGVVVGAASAIALALALIGRSQPYALASTIAAALAATFLWLPNRLWFDLPLLLEWNLLAVLVPAGVVLAAEVWCQKRLGCGLDTRFAPAAGVQHVVAIGVTALLLALVCGGLALTSLARVMGIATTFDASSVESLLILAGLGVLLVGTLWDAAARYSVPALYAWGLGLIAFLLDQWEDAPLFGPLVERPEVRPVFTLLAVGLAAALYVALTGRIWQAGLHWARWGNRLGVPQTVSGLQRISQWLPAVSIAVSLAAVVIEFDVVLSYQERWMRIMAGFAPALAALGLASLAQEARRATMQLLALLFAGGSVVLLGWADMPPDWHETRVLERSIRLVIALAFLTFLLGTVVARVVRASPDWYLAVRRAAGCYGAAAIAAVLLVLALEGAYFVPGVGAPLVVQQTVAMAVVLVGLIVGLLSLALLPGRDPLMLDENGRMAYVYGAQAVGALLFAHLYLANPRLFDAGLRAYWPYIVVAIAFLGVGTGEHFKRARLRVLSEPFQSTGAFLPLLPVIGIWVVAAEHTQYSVLLFSVGLLYALVAMVRQSPASGLAAAVAGNAALWALLDERNFSVLANPQLWAIPPALSVLVAAQVNRQRLGDEALTGVRYAAMLVIYASSTAEIFIRGAETSLWPPMILAVLSVGGLLFGIGLRIRAFLYLGSSFLSLAILSMVWNASRHIGHIWPWFVFGIGLGLAILVLFGVFEKKRKEIGLLIDRMRQWER